MRADMLGHESRGGGQGKVEGRAPLFGMKRKRRVWDMTVVRRRRPRQRGWQGTVVGDEKKKKAGKMATDKKVQ